MIVLAFVRLLLLLLLLHLQLHPLLWWRGSSCLE
jgi:hypothetical protein